MRGVGAVSDDIHVDDPWQKILDLAAERDRAIRERDEARASVKSWQAEVVAEQDERRRAEDAVAAVEARAEAAERALEVVAQSHDNCCSPELRHQARQALRLGPCGPGQGCPFCSQRPNRYAEAAERARDALLAERNRNWDDRGEWREVADGLAEALLDKDCDGAEADRNDCSGCDALAAYDRLKAGEDAEAAIPVHPDDRDRFRAWAIRHRYGDSFTAFHRMLDALEMDDRLKAGEDAERYPHDDGDVVVIGPEAFITRDESVLCYRGRNYVPQDAERSGERSERERIECLRAALRAARDCMKWCVDLGADEATARSLRCGMGVVDGVLSRDDAEQEGS